MISSEVQRTLVKSPPELWTELSDPAALARHLGEFGEIRITRVEPEQTVEWEAENATGTVLIKPSGWGTKVTLSVTREAPEPEAEEAPALEAQEAPEAQPSLERPPEPDAGQVPDAQHDPDAQAPSEPVVEIEPVTPPAPEPTLESAPMELESAPEPDNAPATPLEPELESPPQDELESPPEPEPEPVPAPEPRRGFFARLFGRRLREPELPEGLSGAQDSGERPDDAFAAMSRVLAPETFAGGRTTVLPWPEPDGEAALPAADAAVDAPALTEAHSAPGDSTPDDSTHDDSTPAVSESATEAPTPHLAQAATATETPAISAEVRAAEEVAAEQVTAVLTSVLDRLGAAHHRPFSRS
jgi:hypothetical protein